MMKSRSSGLTVKELIVKLQKIKNQDLPVAMGDSGKVVKDVHLESSAFLQTVCYLEEGNKNREYCGICCRFVDEGKYSFSNKTCLDCATAAGNLIK